MKFYVIGKNKSKKSIGQKIFDAEADALECDYPAIILYRDYFDDYTFKTSYLMYFSTSNKSRKEIGCVRVLDVENKTTELDDSFNELDSSRFCSLGESLEYYEKLIVLGEHAFREILIALNDAFFNEEVYYRFSNHEGFTTSLLRYSSSKALFSTSREEIFNKIYSDEFIATSAQKIKFQYSTRLKYALNPHSIIFDFTNTATRYNRIKILIGKNGTGKTSYLRNLGLSLSGQSNSKNLGRLTPDNPPISNVVMISYSAFDSFFIPKEKNSSYVLCGLVDKAGKVTHEDILNDVKENIFRIRDSKKYLLLRDILKRSNLLFDESLFLDDSTKRIRELSSGQAVLLKFLTDIVKNIQENSILLIDEIETHLHPNFLINLLRFLGDILQSFNAYCVLSTHSPLVVQELDIGRAFIFERIGNSAEVYQRDTSYIAESLSVIVDEIFNLSPRDHLYTSILSDSNIYKGVRMEELNPLARAILESNEKP
jgi:predicted ATPase